MGPIPNADYSLNSILNCSSCKAFSIALQDLYTACAAYKRIAVMRMATTFIHRTSLIWNASPNNPRGEAKQEGTTVKIKGMGRDGPTPRRRTTAGTGGDTDHQRTPTTPCEIAMQ